MKSELKAGSIGGSTARESGTSVRGTIHADRGGVMDRAKLEALQERNVDSVRWELHALLFVGAEPVVREEVDGDPGPWVGWILPGGLEYGYVRGDEAEHTPAGALRWWVDEVGLNRVLQRFALAAADLLEGEGEPITRGWAVLKDGNVEWLTVDEWAPDLTNRDRWAAMMGTEPVRVEIRPAPVQEEADRG